MTIPITDGYEEDEPQTGCGATEGRRQWRVPSNDLKTLLNSVDVNDSRNARRRLDALSTKERLVLITTILNNHLNGRTQAGLDAYHNLGLKISHLSNLCELAVLEHAVQSLEELRRQSRPLRVRNQTVVRDQATYHLIINIWGALAKTVHLYWFRHDNAGGERTAANELMARVDRDVAFIKRTMMELPTIEDLPASRRSDDVVRQETTLLIATVGRILRLREREAQA